MSNFKKKIAALGAAVVMSVSCMSVGASASSANSFTFDLYYIPLAPSSAIKISQSGYYPKKSGTYSEDKAGIVYSKNVNNSNVKIKLTSGNYTYTRYYYNRTNTDYDVFSVKPDKRYKVTASLYNYTNKKTYASKGWIQNWY
ncbi:MAG: hypothetical protein LUE12_04550 [Ruminococcus sp.]|nr:hypothetical protein [Ruminococcus sp.]